MDTIGNIFTAILPTLGSFGVWGYWFILFVSFAEALVIVGAFIPGALFVVFAGVLVSKGVYDIWDMMLFATVGAILGDAASYYIGTFGTRLFKNENKLLKMDHLDRGASFLKKYGGVSLILGRFVGPLRSILPFIAGLTKMKYLHFLLWNVVGGVAWAVSHVLLGYFVGGSIALVHKWSLLITLFVFGVIILLVCVWVLINHFEFVLHKWKLFTIVLLTLSLYQLSDIVFAGASIPPLDRAVHDWFLLVRDDELIWFFTIISELGSAVVIVPIVFGISTLLYYKKRHRDMFTLWCALLCASGSTFLLKMFVARPRPTNMLLSENDFSFPSGHATVAVAFYGILLFLLTRQSLSKTKQHVVLVVGLSIICMIGLSRLYLGVHFVSDIVAGYCVGSLGVLAGTYLYTAYPRIRAHLLSSRRFHQKGLH